MNPSIETTTVEDRAYAQRLLQNIRHRAYGNAAQAWGTVDLLQHLLDEGRCSSVDASWARWLCRRVYGFRPCARVGLKTRPFCVARTRKAELRRVGRIKGGHRRCGISDAGQWFEKASKP